jgi:hypothetical protein
MNILSITLTESQTRPDILDWLTLPETGGGKNTDSHWIINTNVNITNPHNDYHVAITIKLIHEAQLNNYQLVMINKNQ